jgi:hypothetical protein
MRETGRSTRLFHAIVAMGLGAAAAGCGGHTIAPPEGLADAADDAVSTADAPDDAPGDATPEAQGAMWPYSAADAAAADAGDAGSDHWVPQPPVIA